MKKNFVKFFATLFAAAAMCVCLGTTSLAYTETEGKITVDTAKVRESANTGSGVAVLLEKGTTVTIVDETTDSAGTVWYKVNASGKEGYVRSDLCEKGQPVASDVGTTDTAVETTAMPEGVTAMDAQYAQMAVDAGKVRSNASTKDSIVVTLAKGDQVIVDGQKTGSDGKVWYHVSLTAGDGSAYTGFVRNDLVTLGDMVPVEESVEETPAEEEPETPVEEPVVSQDYECVYTDDGTGNNVWYLYDHTNNSRMKLEDLLSYVDAAAKNSSDVENTAKTLKIVVIILAIFFAAAVVAIVVLALKLRDAMYETYDDYEDEEEEEYDEEPEEEEEEEYRPAPRRRGLGKAERREEPEADVEEKTSRRSADEGVRRPRPEQVKPARPAKQGRPTKEVSYEEDDLTVDGAVEKPAPKKKKNFVIDDEDFSFEFLNMD